MTIHLLWISSKLCRKPLRHFAKESLFISCLDLGAQESVQFEQISYLQVKLVLGHVSFPEKIAERRMCGFLLQKKVIHALKDCQSPVLLEVINSCDIKVSFSGYQGRIQEFLKGGLYTSQMVKVK